MTLTYTSALILLAIIPIFLILFVWRGWVRKRQLSKIGDSHLVNQLVAQVSPLRRGIKSLLWLGSLGLIILAIARPTWGEAERVITFEGVQIVFAIDVSRSMDVDDIRPSRLLRARLDLTDMMTTLDGNNMSIVLFAGTAFTYMPMTQDIDAALLFLEDLSTSAITLQGTDFVRAVSRGLTTFNDSTQAQKIMVLVSDGEHHQEALTEVLSAAQASGVTIHTIGYGTVDGGRVPVFNVEGNLIEYKTNPDGSLVNSALEEEILVQIADATGGIYQRATGDSASLSPVVEAIQAAQSGELGEQTITQPAERFGLFAALALLLLSLEIIIPESRLRRF